MRADHFNIVGAGKLGSEYSSFPPASGVEGIICMEIGLKMEAGDCPLLNMNAMRNISVKTVLKAEQGIHYCTLAEKVILLVVSVCVSVSICLRSVWPI